ncbi:MAG: hypothetical protein KatS3mg031_1662 [Chitinophagales bacterium]|nr:MAG: hypothetical protein KatS3mg031_1662 [Chitinophagales bacterium]
MKFFKWQIKIIALVFASMLPNRSDASHAMGADLSYQCLGNDSFLITLNLYRDCAGITAPSSASVDIGASACGISTSSYSLPLVSSQEVSGVCPSQLPNTTCGSGSLPGVEQYIYQTVVVLSQPCTDWVIRYSLCCRNDLITNLQTPGSYDLYVEAHLNNTLINCNNSPAFTTLPVPYVCAGQQFNYSHGAIDADGDSLVYTSINPMGGPTTLIPYVSPFTSGNPLNTISGTGGFVLNSTTGQITFTPAGGQVAVITVLVREYRNNVLIGSTMRDIQVVILPCSNNQPVSSGIIQNSGGNLRDSTTIEVCPGENLSFQIQAVDPDSTNMLTLASNVAQAIPGATFTVTGSGNSLTGMFNWQPTAADTGVNVLTVTITDGACPIMGTTVVSYLIYVLQGTTAGPDQKYCVAGGPVRLSANGGNNFVWSPSSGLSDSTSQAPLASPPVTTTYIVTSDLSSLCKNTDTVTVFVVPDFVMNVSDDDTICRYGSTGLSVTTDNQYAPYTYSWTPTESLINPSTPNPIANPLVTTTYHVAVTSDTGCTIRDSVKVVVSGVGPIVEIQTSKNNVCPGDTVTLTGRVFPLECGPTILGCSAQNLPVPKTFTSPGATSTTNTPFAGANEDVRYQVLYRATDLAAAGINAGTITRIEFEIASKASTGVFQNLTIKLGCTSAQALSTTGGFLPVNTIVYGPAVFVSSLGTVSFPLHTPFDWDGRSNLLMEICFNNGALASPGGNDQIVAFSTSPSYNAALRLTANNNNGCSMTPGGSNPFAVYPQIPKTTFHICEPNISNYTFSWEPSDKVFRPDSLVTQSVIEESQLFSLFVNDGQCEGSGFISVFTDDSYGIRAIPDTTICGSAPVQLDVLITGTPPSSVLPCGVNSTTCSTPSNTYQTGTGSASTGTGTPYEGFWEDGRVQYLYRASELQAAGLTSSGTITAIQYFVTTKGSTAPYDNFTIKMGCTNLSSLPSSNFVAGLTTVYGPISYSTVAGWNTHTLSSPFNWDGSSNIIIEICFDNQDWTDDDDVAYTTVAANSVLYDNTDGSSGCTLNAPSASANRPNTRFTFCTAPIGTTTVQWMSDPTLSNLNIPNPVATPTATTTYKVAYTFVNGCTRRDSVTVEVVSFNTTAGPDTSICRGDTVQLLATGGNAYSWDSILGLSCYNCPNPLAFPDSTTKYYVSVSDANGNCLQRDSVTISVFPSPAIGFSNDTLYCFVGTFQLNAGSGFVSYLWNTGETTQIITGSTAGIYSVTVVDGFGCSASDSIQMTINPPPTVNLGPDIRTCLGDTVVIRAGSGYNSYRWTTNSTDSSITVSTSGLYAVTVTDNNNCPASDTIEVSFSSPAVDFGPDLTLCAGEFLTLIAGSASNTYQWSTLSTDSFIVVSSPDTYWVIAADSLGCLDSDTIIVNYYPANPVDLGPDRTTCNNRAVSLNAGPGYTSYQWSNQATTQAISVTAAGTYSVTVMDANNCVYTDSLNLIDTTPTVTLPNDTSICQGASVTFDAGTGFASYQWNPGNATTQRITVTTAGTYSVTVADANNCTATDQVTLTVLTLPQPNLGPDNSVCPGYILFPGSFAAYNWSDGTMDSLLIVNNTGCYSVTVTGTNGCTKADTVCLQVYAIGLSLSDILLCYPGDSGLLAAPPDMVSYNWSNGSVTASVIVSQAGTYSVTVVNNEGCVASDTAVVGFDSLEVAATANPVAIGPSGFSQLNTVVSNGSGAYSYNWMPDDGSLNFNDIPNPEARPEVNTTYTVIVTDLETGCTDTASVEVIAQSNFVFPDAFTPNGDNRNDVFKPFEIGTIEVIELRIYNRWGQLVSKDPTGWDGKYKGKDQPAGTYSYYAVIRLANGETKTSKGAFSLLR